jgi:hypothetical protein
MTHTKLRKRIALLLAVVAALVLASPAAAGKGAPNGAVRSGSVIIAE